MKKERLLYLLDRFKANECTDQEAQELNEWYTELKVDAGEEQPPVDELFTRFQQRVQKRGKRKPFYWKAAAAVAVLTCGFLFFNKKPGEKVMTPTMLSAKILPGKSSAVMTLSDGTTVNLDDKQMSNIATQAGILISSAEKGQVRYNGVQRSVADGSQMAYNSIRIPKGGQFKVVLPDGTKVWINSESELRFPVTANGKNRSVWLKGEAYFEVAHNKNLPFLVHTADQQVQVLGTHFNIKAYADDASVTTTLLEGSVNIRKLSSGQSVRLAPGQQSVTNSSQKGIAVSAIEVDQAIAWKNGYFLFDNQDIKGVMKAISRWYDVEVIYKDVTDAERFGGTFSRNADLLEILNNLQELSNLHFQVKERKIIVSQK
ncbi:FecR domain-containing protein, partial [Arcticibacter sp.]|uniref:FecR domain-containing protein n=1 Tax=Arcticibacter sp. TaxID=1872630 RepID=UPI00388CF1FF